MMKRTLVIVLLFVGVYTQGQSKENGIIYAEHPSIGVVESMLQAFVSGDVQKVSSYLSEDFKELNGSKMDTDSKGADKNEYLKYVEFWKTNISNMRIERQENAYPDAIKYKDDNGGVWVQTWDVVSGIDNFSKEEINFTLHSLYRVSNDNKIKTIINYYDDDIVASIGRNNNTWREKMLIENHEYINSVKMAFAAFENRNLDKVYSVFDDAAEFRNFSMNSDDSSQSLDDFKEINTGFLSQFDIVSIDMNGTPNLVHLNKNKGTRVQSWWTFKLIRKSDRKKMEIPAMYTHTFNSKGKIIRTKSYVDLDLFETEW